MLTEEQAAVRVGKIGSSDAPDILGVGYGTQLCAYNRIVLGQRKEPSDAMISGTYLERAVTDWAEWYLERPIIRHTQYLDEYRVASLDGEGTEDDGKFILESKTTGINGPCDADYGRAGTSQIPVRVAVQCAHQVAVAGKDYVRVYVAVLRGDGKGFGMYKWDRNEDFVKYVMNAEREFYVNHILPQIPPKGSEV